MHMRAQTGCVQLGRSVNDRQVRHVYYSPPRATDKGFLFFIQCDLLMATGTCFRNVLTLPFIPSYLHQAFVYVLPLIA